MKCPLLQSGWIANPQTVKTEITDCFEEECAWWNNTNNMCAILQLSKSVYFAGLELPEIKNLIATL